jgi:hypothetical protein
MEASINVQTEHRPVSDWFLFITQLENVAAQKDSTEDLHLPVSKFLSQTNSWTRL